MQAPSIQSCVGCVQGEDEVRQSGVPYAVVRPCALTEEPAGAELVISQGDTIKVTPLQVLSAGRQQGNDQTQKGDITEAVESTLTENQKFEGNGRTQFEKINGNS